MRVDGSLHARDSQLHTSISNSLDEMASHDKKVGVNLSEHNGKVHINKNVGDGILLIIVRIASRRTSNKADPSLSS
ncbi:hypothetical protein V3C99_009906 [Haemonchus contortus]